MTLRYHYPDQDHFLRAVDLGKRKVGWAEFFVRPDMGTATLTRAFTTEHTDRRNWTCNAMAELVLSDMQLVAGKPPPCPVAYVCEWPHKYKMRRSAHVNIEDLQDVGDLMASSFGGWAKKWYPGQWKGGVHKDAHHKRIESTLTPSEMASLLSFLQRRSPDRATYWNPLNHDLRDAIGIGLFAVGRHSRGGIHIGGPHDE